MNILLPLRNRKVNKNPPVIAGGFFGLLLSEPVLLEIYGLITTAEQYAVGGTD
jgi:hypothetical protein